MQIWIIPDLVSNIYWLTLLQEKIPVHCFYVSFRNQVIRLLIDSLAHARLNIPDFMPMQIFIHLV
jgi:hypothetical protein